MRRVVPVVDLFSGPGGLAEGFAAFRCPMGQSRFDIALSVEKDRHAHRTLLLRAFLRKIGNPLPFEYYDYLNRAVNEEPDWAALYPAAWADASNETKCMELGTPAANELVRKRIQQLRREHGGRTVLLGGPPCQSYSVIGRSRNVGNLNYNPDDDDRLLLYREYARVLGQLRPALAVMENVKGLLSVRKNGKLIFPLVLRSLEDAGGPNFYRLFALSSCSGVDLWDEGMSQSDFLVRAEEHGVPQSRHRLFVICVRSDVAATLSENCLPRLERINGTVGIQDVIGAMPKLRSRLSRSDDPHAWRRAIRVACERVAANPPPMARAVKERFQAGLALALETVNRSAPPWRDAHGNVEFPESCPQELRNWLFDENIEQLPNNQTRGHMADDLARYLFAASFAYAHGRTPRSSDFPIYLAPNHANWLSGRFADRFRVQTEGRPCTTITSHIAKDGHYYIHPDPGQCRSLTVREAARLQTFPDNYFFHGSRHQQYIQVGNAVPPYLAYQIAKALWKVVEHHDHYGQCQLAAANIHTGQGGS